MPKKNISNEDKILFREAMKSVTPLKTKERASNKPQQIRRSSALNVTTNSPGVEPIYLSESYREAVYPQTQLKYHIVSLPKRRFSQLKHGQIPWQGQLDLHGMDVQHARQQFLQFIRTQQNLGHRCVLVIHGKGGYLNQPSILKSFLNQWLQEMPQVLAFHSAQPQHGGAGAVYILLKTDKNR